MFTHRKARREEREKREHQDRLNAELDLDPSRREGYGKMTEKHAGFACIVRDSDGAEHCVRLEPWMVLSDWLPWPKEHEEVEGAVQLRDCRERRRREAAEIRGMYFAVR